MAPEQTLRVDSTTFRPVLTDKVLSHTNIYGIGATIARMMSLDRSVQQPMWERGNQPYAWTPAPVRRQYSSQLCKLVRQCVRYNPRERISARKLKRKIGKYTRLSRVNGSKPPPPDRGRGMRWRDPEDEPPAELQLYVPSDMYRLGMTADSTAEVAEADQQAKAADFAIAEAEREAAEAEAKIQAAANAPGATRAALDENYADDEEEDGEAVEESAGGEVVSEEERVDGEEGGEEAVVQNDIEDFQEMGSEMDPESDNTARRDMRLLRDARRVNGTL